MVSRPRGNKGKKVLTVYVDPDLLKRFKIRCVEHGISMTARLEALIKKEVEG